MSDEIFFRFEPVNESQRISMELFHKKRIIFMLGPAGCGKTLCAYGLAIKSFIEKRTSKIYLTRPIQATEDVGYLPGDVAEKIAPYMVPFYQAQSKLVYGKLPKDLVEQLPLAYMRGITFNDAVCILDEAQNVTTAQLKLYISRMGKGSKLIICADPTQTDIRQTCPDDYDTDIEYIVDKLENHFAVGVIDYKNSEVVRDPILSSILDRLN